MPTRRPPSPTCEMSFPTATRTTHVEPGKRSSTRPGAWPDFAVDGTSTGWQAELQAEGITLTRDTEASDAASHTGTSVTRGNVGG